MYFIPRYNIPSISGVPNIPKQQFPAYKNKILRFIEEKLIEIHQKIQKYDKKNNIENLNKLENDLDEFWNGREGIMNAYWNICLYVDDEFIFPSFLKKIKNSNTNNIINDFLFYINFSKGEYISEPISMEFIIKLTEIKNRFSIALLPNQKNDNLGVDIKNINIEKNLHEQKNNVKESIINVLNLTGLETWSYKYFSDGVVKEEDIVSYDRMFLNLFSLFYKDKELDERLKKYILKEAIYWRKIISFVFKE